MKYMFRQSIYGLTNCNIAQLVDQLIYCDDPVFVAPKNGPLKLERLRY